MTVLKTHTRHLLPKAIAALVALELIFRLAIVCAYPLYDLVGGTPGYYAMSIVGEAVPALFSIIFVCALGGVSAFKRHLPQLAPNDATAPQSMFSAAGTSYFLALAFVPSIISVITDLSSGTPVLSGWPVALLLALVLDIFVGIFEESHFRGVVFGTLCAYLGRTRKGLSAALIMSALIFGAAHIDFSLDLTPTILAQNVLKVVQVGILGMFFAAISLRQKSLLPAIFLHALWDFSADITTLPFSEAQDPVYAQAGDAGYAFIAFYIQYILLELPLLISAIQILRAQALPERGWFASLHTPANAPANKSNLLPDTPLTEAHLTPDNSQLDPGSTSYEEASPHSPSGSAPVPPTGLLLDCPAKLFFT